MIELLELLNPVTRPSRKLTLDVTSLGTSSQSLKVVRLMPNPAVVADFLPLHNFSWQGQVGEFTITPHPDVAAASLQPNYEYLAIFVDLQGPAKGKTCSRSVSFSAEGDLLLQVDLEEDDRRKFEGAGTVAGTFPEGITVVDNTPVQATVRAVARFPAGLGDGREMVEVQSAPDGTYLITGLSTDHEFDIIGRLHGYQDVIVGRVRPALPGSCQLVGDITVQGSKLQSTLHVAEGVAPYSVNLIQGALPPGVTLNAAAGVVSFSGDTAAVGEFTFTLQATDGQGATDSREFTVIAVKSVDPHFASVVSLLHFEGADTSTVFTDQSGKRWSGESAWSTAPQISAADKRFGSSSLLCNGIPIVVTEKRLAALEVEDFTAEVWFKANSIPPSTWYALFGNWGYNVGWCVFLKPDGLLNWNSGTLAVSATHAPIQVGTWYHLAASRQGGTLKLFLDGVQVLTVTDAQALSSLQLLRVGGNHIGSDGWRGYLDEFRLTRGVARYTGNFTPSPYPFPDNGPEPATLKDAIKNLLPAGYWPMDEGSGATTLDASPLKRHGALSGSYARLPTAVDFQGGYMTASAGFSSYPFNGSTFGVICRVDTDSSQFRLFGVGDHAWSGQWGCNLFRHNSTFYLEFLNLGIGWIYPNTATADWPLGEERLVIVRVKAASLELFVNGNLLASVPFSGSVANSPSTIEELVIGAASLSGSFVHLADGSMRHVFMCPRLISDEEIATLATLWEA